MAPVCGIITANYTERMAPAIERASGTRVWWYHGEEYTFTEWLKHNKTLDDKTRMLYMLLYSEGVAWNAD